MMNKLNKDTLGVLVIRAEIEVGLQDSLNLI